MSTEDKPSNGEWLLRRLTEPERSGEVTEPVSRDPELVEIAQQHDAVLVALDAAAKDERRALLELGQRPDGDAPESKRALPRRGIWAASIAAAAAAMVAAWIYSSTRSDGLIAPRAPGTVMLGPESVTLLGPVGQVEAFDRFHWESELPPGGEYELSIWLESDPLDDQPRILKVLGGSEFRLDLDGRASIGEGARAIRWQILILDSYGSAGEPSSAQAWLAD